MARFRIIGFERLESTNRHACAHLPDLTDGDVIQAGIQSAGHGRLQRRWLSHLPGNLCLSLVLKPRHAAPADLPLANLSQLLALAVCRALQAYGAGATLKWPNDVLLDGRKIAGLLAETVTSGAGEFLGLVLGLGVNLNLPAEVLETIDQPATSLAVWTGRPVVVADFRDAVLEDFFSRCDAFLERGGFASIRDDYRARCPFLGTQVMVRRGQETWRGVAHDIAADGSLHLLTATGELRRVDLGEMC